MKYAWVLAAIAAAVGGVPTRAGAGPAKHVIIISVDGLHQADLTDPALQGHMPTILSLAASGVWYSNAWGTTPSDSFPGTMAYLTGAGPATTGVYYDDSYSRALLPPGSASGAAAGTAVQNTEAIDKDDSLINGGGDCGLGSLDIAKMPLDPARANAPEFPHDYLKVNTIFEIAHAAGLRTSVMDKHPAYEIAAGPSGKGIDDLYSPEIDSKAALVGGKLVDASTAGSDIKFKGINKSVPLAIAYDDLKVAALIREIHGQDARGSGAAPVPGLVAINLQALNIAEKSKKGGIDMVDGQETPSSELASALAHTDASIAKIEKELKAAGLWDQTLLVLTAKHGQNPRMGQCVTIDPTTVQQPLESAGVPLVSQTLDDLALLWLKNPAQAQQAANVMLKLGSTNPGFDHVLWGDSLRSAHLAGPADRTPDVVVTLKPGYVFSAKPKRAEHGGFSEDDTHVPVILTGGLVDEKHRGSTVSAQVKTTQIAISVLDALGLDSGALQGAKIENTQALPGSGLEDGAVAAAARMNK